MTLPSYVINFDELEKLLEIELEETISKKFTHYTGEMKSQSWYVEIPPMVNDYYVINTLIDNNIKLTSISFSQTGYKGEDSWSLYINDETVLDNIYTKELKEVKHWEIVRDIKKGDSVKVVLHNRSGNHRGITVSLEYIEMMKAK